MFCCLCIKEFVEDNFDVLNDYIVKDADNIVKENELFEEQNDRVVD